MHVVTVNDYLARRDSEWMGRLYRFLGMSVGVIQHDLNDAERQVAYGADITYGTNNEFGFDYLRDNMKFDLATLRPARAPLRDRGRGRQHPHRRSAHAAHHFRSGRGIDGSLLRSRSRHSEARARRGDARRRQGRGSRGARERPATTSSTRSTRRCSSPRAAWPSPRRCSRHRLGAELRRPLRPDEHAAAPPHPAGPARTRALQARRRLHGQGRPGRHRRRVHGPVDAGPPLERRIASGRRGEGKGQDRAREPDARDHHVPELLPQVQEALRHDRHGRDRGRGVRRRSTSSMSSSRRPIARCSGRKSPTASTAPRKRSSRRS